MKPSAAVARYHAVKINTANDQTVDVTSAAGQRAFGIVQETVSTTDVTAGRVADVRVIGVSTCIANSAIAIGDRLRVSATEGLLETAPAATAKVQMVGIALT